MVVPAAQGHCRGSTRRTAILGAACLILDMAGRADAQEQALRPGALDDQTEALTRSLARATRLGQPLLLGPGRYRVNRLAPPPGARLLGRAPGVTLVQSAQGPIIAADKRGSLSMSDINLEGAGGGSPNEPLLQASRIPDLDLQRISVSGGRGLGMALEQCGGRVVDCIIEACDVGIHSLDASGLALTGNTIRGCRNNGIQVWRTKKGYDGTRVAMNRIARVGAEAGGSGQYGNGINVFRAGHVRVSDNELSDCAFSAVRANSSDNVQIAGNQCIRLGEVAIFVEFSFEGAIVSGNLVDSASAGVSITNFDQGGRLATVTGNVIRNIFRRPEPITGKIGQGYGIGVEADTVVSGNVVETAEWAGISLGYGPYLRSVICSSNLVRRSGRGMAVSVAPGAGSAQIANNVISECGAGIVGFAWDDPVVRDLIAGAARYPQLQVSGNVVN